jgi:hypothetical protein
MIMREQGGIVGWRAVMGGWSRRWALALAGVTICAAGPAIAQKAPVRPDGIYDFKAAPHSGTLAVKTTKGGLLFEVMTASPKGATCEARGKAIGGTVLTFKEEEAGFRLRIDGDRAQITISGLLGRVSDAPFCGLGGLLTGVYKRSGPLDATRAAELSRLDKPQANKIPPAPGVSPPAQAAPASKPR